MLNAKLTSTERCPGRTLNRILVPPSPLPFSFPFPSTPQPFSTPTWGQLLRSPIVIPPTYHLSSPPHFEQMERQKGQRRSRRGERGEGGGRVRRVRGKRRREKELQVTRPGASRWISNYSRAVSIRIDRVRRIQLALNFHGTAGWGWKRSGRAQINKSNKWMRLEARGENFFSFFLFFLSSPFFLV